MEDWYKRKIKQVVPEEEIHKNKDIVFGTRAIIESIKSGKEVDKLLIQTGLRNELILELIGVAKDHSIAFNHVPVEKLNRVTRKNHQGAICYLSAVGYSSLDHVISSCYEKGKSPLLLILDRVTDVRNFGAIARSAECAGVDAIIIPSRGSAQINSDAMKTSAGALNFIPICREDKLKETLQNLKDNGIQIVSCSEKTENYVYEIDLTIPTAIIMGSEEDGISGEYLKMSNSIVKLPMKGNISSLNVSVAAALITYEAIRQRESL